MKRFFILLTLACFTITSVGLVITQSRCKFTGEIMKSCCGSSDCCNKEVHLIKIQDDFLAASSHQQPLTQLVASGIPENILIAQEKHEEPVIKHDSGPPISIQFNNTFTQAFRI